MHMTQLVVGQVFGTADWLAIAAYFGILLGLAWWVILKSKNTADDYFLAGRNLGWFIVGASVFASTSAREHLVGLAGSGCTDGVAMAHYELHAWCLLVLAWVFVPFYMRSRVFTMPEFLERRFSESSRWVLSLISLVAYILTKIAVGIFAGGVVFGALLPEMHLDLGPLHLDSFWVGSILVIVFTGLYTILGGLRAVAYTEALQTVILVLGSVLVTIFGLKALGGWSRTPRHRRLGDVQPLEAPGPGRRRKHLGPGQGGRPHGLVLQRQLPLAGHALLRPDRGPVVLVHRPVHRPASPGRPERAPGPSRLDLRRLLQAAAGLHLHHPRHDRLRPGQERQDRSDAAGPLHRRRRPSPATSARRPSPCWWRRSFRRASEASWSRACWRP